MRRKLIQNLLSTILCSFATYWCVAVGGADVRLQLLDFGNASETGHYQANEGAAYQVVFDADMGKHVLELSVTPFETHRNRWPVVLTGRHAWGRTFDLSNFTRIEVKVKKISPGSCNFRTMLSSSDDPDHGRNYDNYIMYVPGGATMVQNIPLQLFKAAVNDPSQIRTISFMLPCSPKTEKFQLLSVEAVRDDRLGTANDLLIKELDKLERELATLPDTLSDAAEGVALTELEAINGEIKELRTKIKRAKSQGFAGKYKSVQLRVADLGNRISSLAFAGFKEKAFFWRSPCKVITKKLKPQHTQKIERLDLSMARGECRDLAFMLSAMGGDLNVRLAFESAEPSLAGNVELFFTDYLQYNAQNDWIADLIVPAGTKSINVPKGESREIRIRFFAGAGGVAPGTHAFLLHLGDETSGFRCSLEGSLEVWPFELVSQREIDVLCYAEFKSASQEQVASHFEELAAMKKYGLNVIEIFPQMLNQCRFDNEGNLLEFNARGMELNILEIKRMWNKIPGSQALKFYLICGNNENLPEDMCSPAYENALQQYIGKIAETMQSFGISTDEYFVVLGDEASQAALLKEIPMAEIIKRRHPQLKLLQNSNARFDSEETMRRYFAAFDYFMPCYTGFTWDEGLWPILSQSGKVQATYKCEAMGSTDSPLYEYYRLYPWNTFRLGLRNLGIWSFNARNRLENPLLNHLKCGYSLVVRNKDDSVHHTRRYEIFHEGLSDLRYLITLQQMAENKDGGAAGVKEFLIATLQEVLGNSADTSLAEGGRLKIAGKIMELRK